jgi:hypothetical protein
MKDSLKVALLVLAFATNGIARAVEGDGECTPSQCDAVADNLVANCGFETGDFSGWLRGSGPCFCSVDHAARFSGDWGYINGNVWLVDMGQILQTVPGQQYSLTFMLRNVMFAGGEEPRPTTMATNLVRVYWEGQVVYELADVAPFDWTLIEVDGLVASGPNAELVFGFRDPVNWWNFDDVVVVPSSK